MGELDAEWTPVSRSANEPPCQAVMRGKPWQGGCYFSHSYRSVMVRLTDHVELLGRKLDACTNRLTPSRMEFNV